MELDVVGRASGHQKRKRRKGILVEGPTSAKAQRQESRAQIGERGLERTEWKNGSLIHILSTSLPLLCGRRETQTKRSAGRHGTMLGPSPESQCPRCQPQ